MNPENTQNVVLVLALGDLEPMGSLLHSISSSTISNLNSCTSGGLPAGIQGVTRGKEEGVESIREEPGLQNQNDILQPWPSSGDIWVLSQGKMGPVESPRGKRRVRFQARGCEQ